MRFFSAILKKAIQAGRLEVTDPDGQTEVFGGQEPGAEVSITLRDPSAIWKIMLDPELHAAEAYMDQAFEIEKGSIHDLVVLFFQNKKTLDQTASQRFWRGLERRARRFLAHNPIAQARRNVRSHYDLGNDFYRLWLDADLQYSCACWEEGVTTLEQAQRAKQRRIAAKLALKPGQRVLDIGCGWGGLGLYLASVADVEVVGVTLSENQHEIAQRRAALLGMSDRVTFRLQDYREITEQFDRVVSVGMLEHVGIPQLGTYFQTVHDRLTPDGVALIHSISSREPPNATGPFLRKYIFPGGYSPSLSETVAEVEKTGLWTLDAEIWRTHYAKTLAEWRKRFNAVRPRVVEMYDERFARMWEIYLSGAECAFLYASSCVFQLQLGRDRDVVPQTRDYLASAREALFEREQAMIGKLNASAAAALDGRKALGPSPIPVSEFAAGSASASEPQSRGSASTPSSAEARSP